MFLLPLTAFTSHGDTFLITQHGDSVAMQPCRTIMSAVYDKLKITHRFEAYPGRRALQMANRGRSDAELCRIPAIAAKYQNLIKVSPAISEVQIVAVSNDPSIKITTPADLKPYKLVSITGMKAAEMYFKDYAIAYVKKTGNALALLKDNHVDFALLSLTDLNDEVKSSFTVHSPPLYRHPMHHYINKKHRHLLPKIEATIRQIKAQRQTHAP